ncbi:MAG: ATP-binding cassette domain-containing protein [Puniceicoccaceae bacterium]
MDLELEQIRPLYLDAETIRRSEVWERRIVLEEGSGVVACGPSGRGKSTFLRILFGLERRFTGVLRIGGGDPGGAPFRRWPALRAGRLAFVPQSFELFEDEDGWTNLARPPVRMPGVSDEAIAAWAGRIGIGHLLDRCPETWSQGQRQRFCVLRALSTPFRWLFLDEPVSHLDPDSSARTMDLVREVCAARGAGWILASQTAGRTSPEDRVLRL